MVLAMRGMEKSAGNATKISPKPERNSVSNVTRNGEQMPPSLWGVLSLFGPRAASICEFILNAILNAKCIAAHLNPSQCQFRWVINDFNQKFDFL